MDVWEANGSELAIVCGLSVSEIGWQMALWDMWVKHAPACYDCRIMGILFCVTDHFQFISGLSKERERKGSDTYLKTGFLHLSANKFPKLTFP